jgi:hypothetical protein
MEPLVTPEEARPPRSAHAAIPDRPSVLTPDDLRLGGLAMVFPAVAFTAAAALLYPPAALTLAPIAAALCLVGALSVAGSFLLRRD